MFSNNRLHNRTVFVLLMAVRFFLGLRNNLYSTYISAVAIFALALGVSIITVVLGTINGFEKEISKSTVQLSGHAMLFPNAPVTNWMKGQERLEKHDIIEMIVPFIRTEALISYGKKTFPISFEKDNVPVSITTKESSSKVDQAFMSLISILVHFSHPNKSIVTSPCP